MVKLKQNTHLLRLSNKFLTKDTKNSFNMPISIVTSTMEYSYGEI